MIARVNGADESDVLSSARGRNAASLTSTRSGRGSPLTYLIEKMRNVSFAVSVTRLRTPRIGPAWPPMPVSSATSRSIVWTTDSRGSTYPEGIVQRPFDGPYVLRTTRSFPSRTRNAPAPTVIRRVATFRAMGPVTSPNEMALSQVSFLGHRGGHATEGHVHPWPVPEENLAARELRCVPRRPVARVRGKQGGPVVRLPPGPPDEERSNPPAIRAVRPESGILSGRSMDRGPVGLRGGRELQHLPRARARRARPEDHRYALRQRVPEMVSRRNEDRVPLEPGWRPRQRLRRGRERRRRPATHECGRHRRRDCMASRRSEHRLLRGRGSPGLCRPRRSRRSHGENRRIPGIGERNRGRPREAEALVPGRSGARLHLERPRPRGPRCARHQDQESPVPGPEPVGQDDAPLGPGRKAARVPGEPRWKRPVEDRLSRWQGRPNDVPREGLREPGRLA